MRLPDLARDAGRGGGRPPPGREGEQQDQQGGGGEPPAKKPKPGEGDPLHGPNGLERKEGGNDAGAPCIDLAKGKCPRKKCSFKHAKANAAKEE